MEIARIKFLNLMDIEGEVSPHQLQVKGSLKQRAPALEMVKDVAQLADYIGGMVVNLSIGEDWAVRKEIYPEVCIYFVFNKGDGEFPAALRALYAGEKINLVRGEELVSLTVSCANQMLRYVRETFPDVKLPAVCYKV